jgi:arylsulfatase
MATIAELGSGYPGISCRIPFENGFISEVLAERGWNTYCVGKWHLAPGEEVNMASSKGRWPLGRGFERFYGFLGGESSQWYPDLVYDNHPIDPPGRPEDGYHLSKDLADKAIEFILDAKVVAPDKPFFMYLAPGCGHAPHHVFAEWADRYRGRFDQGYEAIRAEILARQKELGLMPADVELSAINPHAGATGPDGQPWPALDQVRPWATLSDDERRLFARMAEVFAGFVSYTDDQIGRVIDFLDETDQLDNTLVVVVSDNGASAEGGPNGTFNEWRFFNGVPDTTEVTLPHLEELGSPASYNHYNTGWAWAFDTPFPYWKRFAGYEGGVADMCVVAWPARIAAQSEPRQQYVHAVDLVPTIYELLGVDPPEVLKGYLQSAIEGRSFAAALTDADAPGRDTQFYAMLGQRAIYHQGWLASTVHPPLSGWGGFDRDVWELYHLAVDRAQSHNLATQEPDRLAKLRDLWHHEAGRCNGLPLDDRTALEHILDERPHAAQPRSRYVYYPTGADVPEEAGAQINGRSYTIVAGAELDTDDAHGVLYAHGGVMGGHSLYLKDRRLHYDFNWVGTHLQAVVADRDITPGRHVFTAEFVLSGKSDDPAMPGFAGTVTLYIDDAQVGTGDIVTQPGPFCLVGDGICVGRDSASPVTPAYPPPYRFSGGTIDRVIVDLSGDRYIDHEAQVRAWLMRD